MSQAHEQACSSLLWVQKAVNADGNFGHWQYAIARKPSEVIVRMNEALAA